MKIVYQTVVCLIFVTFLGVIANDNLSRKRVDLGSQWLDTSSITLLNPALTEFYLSFKPISYVQTRIGVMPDLKSYLGNLLGIPFISPYGGGVVNSMYRMGLITMTVPMLAKVMPGSLKKALAQQLGVRPRGLIKALQAINTSFDAIALTNTLTDNAPAPATSIYNIRYHYWVAQWHNPTFVHLRDFQEPVFMGAFETYGVTSTPANGNALAFNALQPQTVHFHQAVSPNNARFYLDPTRAIATFWLAAVSQDKQWVNITYFVIAHRGLATDTLAGIFSTATTLGALKNKIERLQARWLSAQDKQALMRWVTTVITAVTEEASTVQVTDLAYLERSLYSLRHMLPAISR